MCSHLLSLTGTPFSFRSEPFSLNISSHFSPKAPVIAELPAKSRRGAIEMADKKLPGESIGPGRKKASVRCVENLGSCLEVISPLGFGTEFVFGFRLVADEMLVAMWDRFD